MRTVTYHRDRFPAEVTGVPLSDFGESAPHSRFSSILDLMRAKYRGTRMLAGGFDRDRAEAWLQEGSADIIAFGRTFLANPDLPRRLRDRTSLNADDTSTYYGGGAKGYTDYPTLEQESGEAPRACVDDRWR